MFESRMDSPLYLFKKKQKNKTNWQRRSFRDANELDNKRYPTMIIFRYLEKRSMLSRKAKFNNLEKEKIEFFFFFMVDTGPAATLFL